MDFKEIYGHTMTGLDYLTLGTIGYLFVTRFANFFSTTLFNKKIKSQKELEEVVSEESKKLGLNSAEFDIIYNSNRTSIKFNDEGKLELHIQGNSLATKPVVKHELYHLKRDKKAIENNKSMNGLYYLFIAEPRATLYGLTGIKL